jgi:hypothetical protein
MTAGRVLRLLLAVLVLHLVLVLPNHPGALTLRALALFPLELPVILCAFAALSPGGRAARLAAAALAAVLVVLTALKLAHLAAQVAFARPFNPVSDLPLADAGLRLVAGTVGVPGAVAAVMALAVAAAALFLALRGAARAWTGVARRAGLGAAASVGAVLAMAVAVAEAGQALGQWPLPLRPPGAAFTARSGYESMRLVRITLRELEAFRAAAASDPQAGRAGQLARLGGADATVIFVESYGRAALENPRYAGTTRDTLAAAAAQLAGQGLALRSGWLTAPIAGGQSWLSHATFASGLDLGDQARYAAFLASPRLTLWQIAGTAGHATAAVMPAITRPWPDAARLGFGRVLAAGDLGYAGQPFNWVTMPDQYTLAAYPARLGPRQGPRLTQVALISSHAPWVPVPELVAWDTVGDGRVFDAMAAAGDPPEVVWRDRDRVRMQYGLALDYALRTVTGFAANGGAGGGLLVVLGDHQPAAFVAERPGRDVPVHLIGPPALVAAFDDWGWTPGLIPAPELAAWPMAAFRDRFLDALAAPGSD